VTDKAQEALDMQRETIDWLKSESKMVKEHRRDMFACAAMQAFISNGDWEFNINETIAKNAYDMADEMLKARGRE
jgi:hypothetical protein